MLPIFTFKRGGLQEMYFYLGSKSDSRMLKCLDYTNIAIGEMSIFPGQCDMYGLLWMRYALDKHFSIAHVRLSFFSEKSFLDQEMDILLLKGERHLVDGFLIDCFYDMVRRDTGKHREFVFDIIIDWFRSSTYEDTWMDTEFSQFDDGMLDSFGFHLT